MLNFLLFFVLGCCLCYSLLLQLLFVPTIEKYGMAIMLTLLGVRKINPCTFMYCIPYCTLRTGIGKYEGVCICSGRHWTQLIPTNHEQEQQCGPDASRQHCFLFLRQQSVDNWEKWNETLSPSPIIDTFWRRACVVCGEVFLSFFRSDGLDLGKRNLQNDHEVIWAFVVGIVL